MFFHTSNLTSYLNYRLFSFTFLQLSIKHVFHLEILFHIQQLSYLLFQHYIMHHLYLHQVIKTLNFHIFSYHYILKIQYLLLYQMVLLSKVNGVIYLCLLFYSCQLPYKILWQLLISFPTIQFHISLSRIYRNQYLL